MSTLLLAIILLLVLWLARDAIAALIAFLIWLAVVLACIAVPVIVVLMHV